MGKNIIKMKNSIYVTDDKTKIDFDMVYEFTTKHSFSKGISRARFDVAMNNSWCFGIFVNDKQVGFTRLITDYATFGWFRDVFILPEYRRQGYALMLMQYVVDKVKEKDFRRIMLGTLDKHNLFKKVGLSELKNPEWFMEYQIFDDYVSEGKW